MLNRAAGSLLIFAIILAGCAEQKQSIEPEPSDAETEAQTPTLDAVEAALQAVDDARTDRWNAERRSDHLAFLRRTAEDIPNTVAQAITGELQDLNVGPRSNFASTARNTLSDLYLEGIGVEQDLTMALMWALLAYPDPNISLDPGGYNEEYARAEVYAVINLGLIGNDAAIREAGELALRCDVSNFSDCPLPTEAQP